jgi:endonuclease/exonuclease/phosphatase family metal-dependent hydrolase
VVTINMHKGVSALHARSTVQRLRQKIRETHPDLVFIQELRQEFRSRMQKRTIAATPGLTQFLAEGFWSDWHYGKNVIYERGHHGNAILSQLPMRKGENYDVSAYRFERRGVLHAEVSMMQPGGRSQQVHCFCVHLALFERGRRRQLESILQSIEELTHGGPTIVAGDFNDWRNRVSDVMSDAGFIEAFESLHGMPARTFPSVQPMLRMDRIYVRGLRVRSAELMHDWHKLSDHLGIAAELQLS